MSDLDRYLEGHGERHLGELEEFLRIPSVSAKREHREDTTRAAEWLAERMREAGLERAEVIPTAGHPVVIGEWRGLPGAPTLLVYGHYDVQPAEPLDEWISAPFEPTRRDGKLFARGSVDDKGQLYLHLKAVEAHLAVRGRLPVNVVFAIEGEEEIGSIHLADFLERNRERLRCDAVLISDTTMFAPGLPSITTGLRGLAYLEVRVQGPKVDLHSGAYGGAVVNPANALAGIIAGLKDEAGRVTIPGFYDRVRELTAQERESLARLPFEEEGLREEVGATELGGERGYGALERIWARPTLDVNGLLSGYTGEGAKTVLPARAMAKISMRLVPEQDYRDIERRFEAHVRALAPAGVTVEVEALHGGQPWRADPAESVFDAASRALERAFGRAPVFVREGGSIPIVEAFQRTFAAPVVLIGFGLPGENAHAPNEWISLENYRIGTRAIAYLYDEIESEPGAQ
jgi:acetylornithine deacetylase/succinyl-diaminopimelate desuccinylase-like protein